jgi:uncharacterized protein (TIGR03437 family)
MRFLLFFVLSFSSYAQIRDVVTTHDGSRVYFVSTAKLRNSNESLASKLFMIDSTGTYLLDDEGTVAAGDPYSNVSRPNVTDDGSLVIETATRFCNFGSPCIYDDLSTPRSPPGMKNPFLSTDIGGGSISRNGRYAAIYNNALTPPGLHGAPITLIDLSTGDRVMPAPIVEGPVQVTSSGVVLASVYQFGGEHKLSLIDAQNRVTSLNPTGFNDGSISDDGSTIVYTNAGLYISDATGNGKPLGTLNSNDGSPRLNSDGSSVVFLSGPDNQKQLFFIRRDGSGRRALTNSNAGIVTAALSGDGKIAYAVTGTSALLKIDTQSGDIQQIVSPMPQVGAGGGGSPGSLVILSGTTLASSNVVGAAPYPTTLGGITITIGGRAAPILSVSPSQVVFQIPWESQVDPTAPPTIFPRVEPLASTVVLPGGDPYFDVGFAVPLFQSSPRVFALGGSADGYPAAAHSNGMLVTTSNPAVSGEVVTLYGTGFGPVTPALTSGAPAPLNTLILSTMPFSFTFRSTSFYPVTTQFLGLAPGTVGIYQLNIQIPSNMPHGNQQLAWKTPDSDFTGLALIPVM